ncbi:DEAD/DEAH box helicase [Sneathiella litorea]|uniref:DEAD/DEAH box helicase n=1 Tax=Sneathiella litorea TaxID=2606216 RepID=A0A6L8W8Y7_9PROT|nr:DEAD/DEAH box helicase [Sneathiella litorea]MZR31596.1 DEAD/DEAH box helicase [Sneathiella litorea]
MTGIEDVTPPLAMALDERGYTVLTPVQTAMLNPDLKNRDALVSAQTGSGKTVAFGLAMATTLLEGNDRFTSKDVPVALIIAPTRELALQVKSEIDWLYAKTGASVVSCVGGMDARNERRNLDRGAHIVVGTPGRLRDHIERGAFNTSGLKCVVLDEADEMLDMGFREDLEYILDTSPVERRTMLFSATVPRMIASLAKRYQRDAVRISTAAEEKQHQDIEYKALTVAPNDRQNAIVNILRFQDAKNAIVFCGTRVAVTQLASRLNNRGFSVVALSGELSQNERSHALQAMRDGRAQVCVATDVAARGIDLPNLELVIHADLPRGAESLLHRSGRTGRAGRKGVSALIVPYNWRKRTERLLHSAKVKAVWERPPSLEDVIARDQERFLSDPCLTEPIKDDEKAIVKELLENHSADQIAAALVRIHHTSKPAAEELLDQGSSDSGQPKRERQDFSNGVWFELSVGRKHTAEPRWLLPMLCRAGHITKNEIGPIRIQEEKTFVELDGGCVDAFLKALGPSRKMEKTVEVTRLDRKPDIGGGRDSRPRRNDRKPRRDETAGSDNKSKPRKRFDGENAHKKPYKKADKREDRSLAETRKRDNPVQKDHVTNQQDEAAHAYNKRFGDVENPTERFKKKRFKAGLSEEAQGKDKATKSAPKKPSHSSDDDRPVSKFNRKPKEKKLKPKKNVNSKDGAIKDGFRANKLKKAKPEK